MPTHYPVDILIAPSYPPVITADAPVLENIVAIIVRSVGLELVGLMDDGGMRVLGTMSPRMAELIRARRQSLLVALNDEDVMWARRVCIGAVGQVTEVSLDDIRQIGISLAYENVSIEGLNSRALLCASA